MDYLKNHCWCSDSNWGSHYDCQIIVSLSSYKEGYEEDWENITTTKPYYDKSNPDINTFVDSFKVHGKVCPEEKLEKIFTKNITVLKPEILQWLYDNVPDLKDGTKGWAIGSDKYIANGTVGSYCIFFQRRQDAMKFIKTWSKWKKPIHYCQYFTDVRKELNLETLKYEDV